MCYQSADYPDSQSDNDHTWLHCYSRNASGYIFGDKMTHAFLTRIRKMMERLFSHPIQTRFISNPRTSIEVSVAIRLNPVLNESRPVCRKTAYWSNTAYCILFNFLIGEKVQFSENILQCQRTWKSLSTKLGLLLGGGGTNRSCKWQWCLDNTFSWIGVILYMPHHIMKIPHNMSHILLRPWLKICLLFITAGHRMFGSSHITANAALVQYGPL